MVTSKLKLRPSSIVKSAMHLWITPDRPTGLQGEGLVDREMMDERAGRLQCLEPVAFDPGGLTMTLVPYSRYSPRSPST